MREGHKPTQWVAYITSSIKFNNTKNKYVNHPPEKICNKIFYMQVNVSLSSALPIGKTVLAEFLSHVSYQHPREGGVCVQVSYGYYKDVKPMTLAIWGVQLGIDHRVCGYVAKVTNPALGGLIVRSVQHKLLSGKCKKEIGRIVSNNLVARCVMHPGCNT